MVATHQPPYRIPQGWPPFAQSDKNRKPGLSEFLINPSRVSKHSRTSRRKMRLTLKKGSRRNQIRTQPFIRMNLRILPNPIPPPTNSIITTMNNNRMNKNTETTLKTSNNMMKLINTKTPNNIKVTSSNRITRSNCKDLVPLSSEFNRPSKRKTKCSTVCMVTTVMTMQ